MLLKSFKMNNIYENKQFLLILILSVLYSTTFSFFTFSMPLIIYELTRSVFAMSMLRAIEFIPNLLLAIIIGVIVDRYKRKNLILWSSVIQFVCIISLFTLIYLNLSNLILIYFICFLIFSTGYMRGNSIHSILPNAVSRDYLTEANSKITLYRTISNIIVPSLAGILYATYGIEINLIVFLIGSFIALLLLSGLKIDEKIKKSDKNFKEDIIDGWYALYQNNTLWNLTLIIFLMNVASALSGAVLIFFALDSLYISESRLGYILTGSAVGALIGAKSTKHLESLYDSKGKIFILSFFMNILGYLLLTISSNWIFMMLGMLIIGFGVTQTNIQYLSLRQSTTPNHLLGRVAGTSSMLMKLATPIAYIIAGAIGEFINLRYIFVSTIFIFILLVFYSYKNKIHEI